MRGLRRLALGALLLPASALGGERALPAPGGEAWEPLALPKVERATSYEPVTVDGRAAVRSRSDCSASALVLPLADVDLESHPRLRWRWRVERSPHVDDERVREGDDFAARVYVIFPFEPEHASFLARMRQRLGRALYGDRVPGSALNYVWSSQPAGSTWDNPFAASSKMVSLGDGPLGEWRAEDVDVRADFERLFGRPPPRPSGLALMTDSDNSCQAAEALFADFRLAERSTAPAGSEPAPSGRGEAGP